MSELTFEQQKYIADTIFDTRNSRVNILPETVEEFQEELDWTDLNEDSKAYQYATDIRNIEKKVNALAGAFSEAKNDDELVVSLRPCMEHQVLNIFWEYQKEFNNIHETWDFIVNAYITIEETEKYLKGKSNITILFDIPDDKTLVEKWAEQWCLDDPPDFSCLYADFIDYERFADYIQKTFFKDNCLLFDYENEEGETKALIIY